MQSAIDTITDLSGTISSLDTTVNGETVGEIIPKISLVFTVIYVVIIVMSFLGVIAAVSIGFCGKEQCRHLTYFACVLLFILGFISFIIVIVVSVVVPTLYVTCDFLTVGVSNSTMF